MIREVLYSHDKWMLTPKMGEKSTHILQLTCPQAITYT